MPSRAKLALIVCLFASFFQLYEAFQLRQWSGRHTHKRDLGKLAARSQHGGSSQGDQDRNMHGHCPSGRHGQNITEILAQHNPEEFCSRFLHIIPDATTTTTQTSTKTDDVTFTATASATTTSTQTVFATETATTTLTETSTATDSFTTTLTDSTTDTSSTTTTTTTTATTSSGTVTDSTTDSTTTTTTTTDATLTSTITSTTTSTSTTTLMRRAKRSDDIPPWLPFPRRQISSACLQYVHPMTTDVVSATATTTTTSSFTTTSTDTTIATATTTDTDITATASTTTTTTGTTDVTTSTTTTGTDSTTTTTTSTSITTSTVPQTTTTATEFTTSTITSFVTDTTTTTTTTAITSTATLAPPSICVASCPTNVYGGINEIDSSNYLECIFLSGDYCLYLPSGQLVFDTGASCPATSPSSCNSCSYTCPGTDTTGAGLAAYYYNYNGSGNNMICIYNNDAECLYDHITGVSISSNLDSNTCPSAVAPQC